MVAGDADSPGKGGVVDRLIVDLYPDGRAMVSAWPEGDDLPDPGPAFDLAWPVDADALADLRWYLEDYLAAPFEVYGERGPQFEARLAEWGAPVFGALFAPVGRCSPFPRRRLCAHLAGSVQSSLPARVMRSEPDATPCAQAAQLNVSPRPTSDVDQPPVATHQIDQICSYQKSVAI